MGVYSKFKTNKASTLVEGIIKFSHEWKTMFIFLGRKYHEHPADGLKSVGVWSNFRTLSTNVY